MKFRMNWLCALGVLSCLLGCGGSSPVGTSSPTEQENRTDSRAADQESIEQEAIEEPVDQGTASWPWWRGPHYDGISRERNYLSDWSSPPPVAWKKDIGIGYSSVSIQEGRLFAIGHPAGSETETVWCLNPETGEEYWTVTYPCALLDHLHKGGPGATPTIHGDYVYTNSREGEIRKIDVKTGEVIWVASLRQLLRLDLPEWGFTCSPVIRGDELLLEAGSVLGMDQATGKLNWKTEPHMPGYGTPEMFQHQGHPFLAALNNEGLAVIDLKQKREIAFFDWDSPYHTNSTTPIWQGGQLFVSTGYNIGCVMLNFDGVSLSPEWQNKNMRNHMNSCVLHNGYLYGVDGNSHMPRTVTVNCISWETGELMWSAPGMGCGAVSATPEHLLITSDTGELILADLTPEAFREQGRVRTMREQCWTVPTLCNGLIYVRGADGTLACVNARK